MNNDCCINEFLGRIGPDTISPGTAVYYDNIVAEASVGRTGGIRRRPDQVEPGAGVEKEEKRRRERREGHIKKVDAVDK